MKLPILLCLCFALISSCGPKKVAVKYADTYIETQVEKRLPLYDSQEEALSKDIDKFLNGHKEKARQILPILAKVDLERPASLDEQYPKFSETYLDIASDFSKILARHMSVFDKKQQKDFLKKMREENNDLFTKGRKERQEKVESRVRSLLGTVTDDQKKILKANRKTFDEQIVVRSERRSKLHTAFKDILEQEISSEAKEKLIHEAFIAYQKESLSDTRSLTIAKAFMPTLKPIQKENIRARLGELEEILTYFVETVY
ncbi:MAG: hypothetical protein V4598_07700 [Bdellovibrionota bacterium]